MSTPVVEAVLDHVDLWAVPVFGGLVLVLAVATGGLAPQWMLALIPVALAVVLTVVSVKFQVAAQCSPGPEH